MGADEYHPNSHKGTNLTEAGGIGYIVVDALDTMRSRVPIRNTPRRA